MIRRRALAACLAVLLAPLRLGAQAPLELSLWHAMAGPRAVELEHLVLGFNAEQDRWRVVPSFHGDYDATLVAVLDAIDAGTPPHIVQIYEVGTRTMLRRPAAIRPLEPLLAGHRMPLRTDGFLAAAAALVRDADGRLAALPFNISTPVLIVNAQRFRAAGLDPARPPDTWAAMEVAADRLDAAGTSCVLATGWPVWVQLENFLAWHDLPLATQGNGYDGPGAELVLDHGSLVAHLGLLRRWARAGWLDPDPASGGRRFAAGECAMLTGSSATASRLAATGVGFDLAVGQLPYRAEVAGAPRTTTIGGAALWALAGHTPEEEAGAAAFLAWLATPERQAAWHLATGYLPVTAEAFVLAMRSGGYRHLPGGTAPIAQLTSQPPTANARAVRLPAYPDVRAVLEAALKEARTGTAPIPAILAEAKLRGDQLIRAAEATPAAR